MHVPDDARGCVVNEAGGVCIEFVPEMQPVPGDGRRGGDPVPPCDQRAAFAAAWEAAKPAVARAVTAARVVALSRWARQQTEQGADPEADHEMLPAGWVDTVPMSLLEMHAEAGRAVYGCDTEEGLPLPSHSPIVFRRLVLRAELDCARNVLIRVYVTIKGWREE
eukprot:TRINITY_DN2949_c0_g1_i1.p1 TRINITY_DN2949_c0_g1~~TRINITY_DN2949_c0_g1_i1.p1  ORF type:complete len:165 (-),score=39.11 TRINITY_DN2949_c0_g1_i1:97-591(-)